MSTPASLIPATPTPRRFVRDRHGVAGVLAQYIQDITHPAAADRVVAPSVDEVLLVA